MSINVCLPSNNQYLSKQNKLKNNEAVSFGSAPAPVFVVKKSSFLGKILPSFAFSASIITTLGYSLGSAGLFYDSYKENGDSVTKMFSNKKSKGIASEGVQTIIPTTKLGKLGLLSGKVAVTASASSGVACGLGEGVPMMALGEATNMSAGRIIETPIGTGLFGIGIGSVFSGLALDNTPELKLNHLKMMAENSIPKKAKMVARNMGDTMKEIGSSVVDIAKNITNPKFFKENFLEIAPRTVVFQESINKDGKVIISKALRHNKNYLMHAASFTLGLGGLGVIGFSLLKNKTAQKNSLRVEEGGFLFDNLGMTKYGLDKFSTGGKYAGSGYAVGGVINSISQIMGIDNKNGRAMQWAGIALVFLGFSVDRGKTLKKTLATAKKREQLTDVVREWKFDLTNLVDKNKPEELKKLLDEIKNNKPVTNTKFNQLEKTFTDVAGKKFVSDDEIKGTVSQKFGKEIADNFVPKKIADFEETKKVLQICTEKIFGSKDPTPVN